MNKLELRAELVCTFEVLFELDTQIKAAQMLRNDMEVIVLQDRVIALMEYQFELEEQLNYLVRAG